MFFVGWRRSFLLTLVWLVVAGGSSVRAAEEWLPLAKGNAWVYRGLTRWTDGEQTREETLIWRMEVTEVIQSSRNFAAVVVKGFPGDLAWYEPGKKPGDYLIVRVGRQKYYLLEGDRAAKVHKQLGKGQRPSAKTLEEEGEWLVDGPLTNDKRYGGEPKDLARGRYCWVVEEVAPFASDGIAGLPEPSASRQVSSVAYRTNPDHQVLSVVPGVGIVGYVYKHHGTVSETDMRLVEVHLARP